MFHLKKKKKAPDNEKPAKSAEALIFDGMAMFTVMSALALFNSRLTTHTGTLKVYAPKSGPYFWIYEYGSKYLHEVLVWLTGIFQTPDAFGWAVVILTVVIKLISFFNRLLVAKKSINVDQRRGQLKEQLKIIEQVMLYVPLTQTQVNQLHALRQDCLVANQAHNSRWPYYINIAISVVMMTALYQSVAYSTHMHDIYFLTIDLSQRSLLLTVISSVLYLIANTISWHYLSPLSRAHTGLIYYFITPITTFLSGYFLPSIITLYWITSASCLIIQYCFTYWLLYPLFKKQAVRDFVPRIVITKDKVAAITQ